MQIPASEGRKYGEKDKNLFDFLEKFNKFLGRKRPPTYLGGRFLKIAVYFLSIRLFLLNFASVILNYKIMRGRITFIVLAFLAVSCAKESLGTGRGLDYTYGRELPHDKIVLGDRLENPYTTENMTKALQSLYPTKADRVDVKATHLYVRFLPRTEQEYDILNSLDLAMTDHPLDYDIVVEGDWYHDPAVPEGEVTWQYAVVPPDFEFPDIRYEIIDECYISENDAATRADGIDWEAVERESYVLTGNADRLATPVKGPSKVQPEGRITIEDEQFNGGKPFGVAGVRISCNSFVKFDHATTDRDGYFKMEKSFSSKLRYRLVFENEKGFSIGLNLVLVPASVSTLGRTEPTGVNMTITKDSDDKLFRRCVVNNAAYEYFSRCNLKDLGLAPPPSDLRIWIFHKLSASSAVMLHHGALLSQKDLKEFLGDYADLVSFFLPDITIGAASSQDYSGLYSSTVHELAHASHFTKVGTDYWNKYILYIVQSFLESRDMTYGDGTGLSSGYCEIGEMWAYYLESRFFKDRYGGSFPTFGTSYWFYPQIFRFLDERGMKASQIFSVLRENVTSRPALKEALMTSYPDKRTMVEQVFSRY